MGGMEDGSAGGITSGSCVVMGWKGVAVCSAWISGILRAMLLLSDFIKSSIKDSEPGKATTTIALVNKHNSSAKSIPAAVNSEKERLVVVLSAMICYISCKYPARCVAD